MSLIGTGLSSRISESDKPPARAVTDFHTNADTDGSPKALHHTLGPGPNQAAAGNHSHDAGSSSALSGYASVNHNHDVEYYKARVPWSAMSMQNGWTNYALGYKPAQFRRVGDNVYLRGLIKHAVTTTTGVIDQFSPIVGGMEIFIQPASAGGSSVGTCRIDIQDDGKLVLMFYGPSSNGGWVSLSKIYWSEI